MKRTPIVAAIMLSIASGAVAQQPRARRVLLRAPNNRFGKQDEERIHAQITADTVALKRIYVDDFLGIGPTCVEGAVRKVLSRCVALVILVAVDASVGCAQRAPGGLPAGDSTAVRRELAARHAENEAGFFARDADRVMRLRIRTPEGWLLWQVDETKPGQTLVDGRPPQ